ncbi:MAG TPA: OmpA family protein [Polyangiaceae bacterium]|nr:OmpA family protein [Polyangiaceae bacterium]
MLLAHVGAAQAAEGTIGASASADTSGAQATGAADAAGEPAAAESAPAAEPAPAPEQAPAAPSNELPYMQRYKPEKMTWEVGLFTGLFLPSGGLGVYSPRSTYQSYDSAAWELGGRLAFFPLTFLGVEGEFMMANGSVPNDLSASDPSLVSNRANFFAYRGQVIGQLPFWSIVPFLAVGGGALVANSQPLGSDMEGMFHFGGGVKVPLTKDFSLRADFRENMGPRANDNYGGISFNEEVQLGGTFTFGRKTATAAADRDRDGLADDKDACPDEASLSADGCAADSDGDGIKDPVDDCPREAGTGPNGCADPDTDKDGVPLPCDQCPAEAGNVPDGCPTRAPADTDGDGLTDDVDKCVKEPETKNGFEDDDGCPDEIPKEVEKFTGSIEGISFVQGSSKITKGSDKTLKAAADILKKYPSLHIEISGHTSSEGKADVNQKLSESRAASVREWLLKDGVPESQITSRGAGPTEPIADNATPAGRAKNRRIEFTILKD